MNGAESLVHTLLKSEVDTCFANPGTSEMHFVAALDRIPGMRCVLGLQENIVFMGRGRIFEIWEPEGAKQRVAQSRLQARERGLTLPPRGPRAPEGAA